MITNRIIPVLLLKNRIIYKSVNFKNLNYIGDPINAIKIFNEKEIDELIILDIGISNDDEPDYKIIQELASECFMPLSYGGGVKTLDIAKKIFNCGVEKVIINSKSYDSTLIKSIASQYGNQSIIIGIDYRKSLFLKKTKVYINSGKQKLKIIFEDHLKNVLEAGAGEIFIQSIDRDGTYNGYDLVMLRKLKSKVSVPIIICGGAKNNKDLSLAISNGANGVAAGSIFVYKGTENAILINYPAQKNILNIMEQGK